METASVNACAQLRVKLSVAAQASGQVCSGDLVSAPKTRAITDVQPDSSNIGDLPTWSFGGGSRCYLHILLLRSWNSFLLLLQPTILDTIIIKAIIV